MSARRAARARRRDAATPQPHGAPSRGSHPPGDGWAWRVGAPAWAAGVALACTATIALLALPEPTYLQFHLAFTIPPLVALAVATLRARRRAIPVAGGLGRGDRFALGALGVHVLVAVLYTTPWDNHLVARGVWGYPDGRVLATIGHVPVEEYLFFVLQTILVGLTLYAVARVAGPLRHEPATPRASAAIRIAGVTLLLAVAALGAWSLGTDRGTYLGLILVWALPVLALQWGFGGDLIVRRWRVVLPAIALPTVYLWIADLLAIHWSIWWISPEATIGVAPLGLPIEEALFFLVTTCLVVFGLTLALHPAAMARVRSLRSGPHRPLLALWALSMVPAPLVPGMFVPLAYASTGLLAGAVLVHALARWGARAFGLFAAAFTFGLVIEAVGARTGVPFGAYDYTSQGPALLGVPVLVPLGWFAFTMIALHVAPRGRALLIAPLALVAWDLALDPLMVQQGFWSFAAGGAYHGVPLSNFVGWYLTGLALTWLLVRIEPRLQDAASPDLRAVYLAQAFLMGAGLVLFGLPAAALVAVPAMLAVASTWWWPARRTPGSPVVAGPP